VDSLKVVIKAGRRKGTFSKVKVLFYSGYKGEETPRSIILDNEEIAVEEILFRKRTFHARSEKGLESFTCKTRRGIVKLQELASGEWVVRFRP
jgi:hypothetical protein